MTVSQLTDSASGIHTRHAPFYYRRVRQDIKDPVTDFMAKQGIPNEPCVLKPHQTVIFTFPKEAPEYAVFREDLTAIQHLEIWLTYQMYWCEHKPSITISVKEHEWPAVGQFVWENFDWMSGVSFLPYDGGNYRQAPYEECSEEEFNQLNDTLPKDLPWEEFIEIDDETEGAQNLACVAGYCEI